MYTLHITPGNENEDFDTKVKEFKTHKELLEFALVFINQTSPDCNYFECEVPEVNFTAQGFVNEVKMDLIETFKK